MMTLKKCKIFIQKVFTNRGKYTIINSVRDTSYRVKPYDTLSSLGY